MPALLERTRISEAAPFGGSYDRETAKSGAVLDILLITPGWGSSGYYSADVLEAAGKAGMWPAGTFMYLDHPTPTEDAERPARSVRDLAAVLLEGARWENGGLRAKARVYSAYRPMLAEMAEDIGVSIRSYASMTYGEAEGKAGPIVTEILEGISVDFVTRAGRGGRIVEVLESARAVAEARNIGNWIESRLHFGLTQLGDDMFGDGRLTREERITLSGAVGDALTAFTARVEADAPQLYTRDLYDALPASEAAALAESVTSNDTRTALTEALREAFGAEKTWLWVCDFDESTVWFQIDTSDGSSTYSLGYAIDEQAVVTFDGAPVEVRAVTTYVPVATTTETHQPPVDPAGQSTPQESEEDTMPQIEEARLRQLEEDAGRVRTLESERDAAVQRATEADEREAAANRALAESNARTTAAAHARTRVTEANETLPAATVDRIVEAATRTVPLTESGELDTTALDTATDAARTAEESYLATLTGGKGVPTGLGGAAAPAELSEADADARLAKAGGYKTKEA